MAAEIVVRIGIDGLQEKASSLLREDFSSLGFGKTTNYLKQELQFLVQNLAIIQALLPDAERKAESSSPMLYFLKRIVKVASRADNVLSQCAYDVGQLKVEKRVKERNKVRHFFSSSKPFMLRLKFTHRIPGINLSLERIYHESAKWGVGLSNGTDISAELEETMQMHFSPNESQLSNYLSDVEMIKHKILYDAEERDLGVICIFEMEGVGKATIPGQVYRDFDVSNHFDERLWVRVSEDFDITGILKGMLQSITRTTCKWSWQGEIIIELNERLRGKKYLLVLDDVLNDNNHRWFYLKERLLKLGGARGSIVLATTRSERVGQVMQPFLMHLPRPPSQEECYIMFEKIAFAEGGPSRSPNLQKIGMQISRQWKDHPLLIKLFASLFYTKKNEREWLMIAEGATCLGDDPLKCIKFCYDHLPSLSIKQCFEYCSIFATDSTLERDELVQLWMAQGFLNPPEGSSLTMEGIGTKYLNILMQRNFLQDVNEDEDKDEDENKRLCKMHSRFHDFALGISPGYCSIIKGMAVKEDFKATHLTLIKCKVEMSKTLGYSFAMLRTLRLEDTRNLEEILKYTKNLRVLVVVDWNVQELPISIGKLRHLRYLDISKTGIVRLPSRITKLYNLQTLRMSDLEELPNNFENLISLRYFHVENLKSLGKLNSLPPKIQELINHSSSKASLKTCLGRGYRINKLKQKLEQTDRYSCLKIYCLENVNDGKEAREANLSKMYRLDSLKLHWNARRENRYDEDVLEGLKPHPNTKCITIENFKGLKFPSWVARTEQHRYLVKIELENCSCCEQIPSLGHLRYLKIVRISGMDSVKCIDTKFYGYTEHPSSHCSTSVVTELFPALREFSIKNLTNLQEWHDVLHIPRAFPRLQTLEVEQCPKLTRLPDTLNGGCKYLQRLEIAFCNKLTHLPEVLGGIEFLRELDIRGLPSLPEASIGNLDKLESLTIGSFLSSSEDNHHAEHASTSNSNSSALPSSSQDNHHAEHASTTKSSLHLEGSSGLPEQVQYLSKLRSLTIWGHGELEILPEWLGKLRRLQNLKLELCGKLKSFPPPDALRQLKELNVCLCPLLEERCMRGSRPEWHRISHIPTIKMSYETIQSRN